MMKFLLILSLYFRYSAPEFTSASLRQYTVPCKSPNKNALIEHFFNTVFSEFYSSPPVCVCVQMCVGQSTYCYPNRCLKTTAYEEKDATTETTTYPIVQRNKNHFMLVKGERDFMTEFLERNYVDESKEPTPQSPAEVLRPDVFKKKYNIIGKYKSTSNLNLRHTIQDKVKKDVMKTEGDWKTKWPLNSQYWRNGRRSFSKIDKPSKTQGTYFAAMLHDNEVLEYPPKNFKRELTKNLDDDEGNLKTFYHLENSLNMTNGKNFSLEALIDNLIKSSFGTNIEAISKIAMVKRNDTEIESKVPIENVLSVNSTKLANETTSVISMNFTNENLDRNKYLDTSEMKNTASLSEMITILANRIEVENNTSLEIARRTLKELDEETLIINNDETTVNIIYNDSTPLHPTMESPKLISTTKATPSDQILTTETVSTPDSERETTTLNDIQVTKKNRQKIMKKASSKLNNPDLNPNF